MTAITHHNLKAEHINDAHGAAILLTQQGEYSEPSTVIIHPWQLRRVCEEFGIVSSDTETEKLIARLSRRMQLLNGRIQHLDNWLRTFSDSDHADLNYEMSYSGGTADMAQEFCTELIEILATTANHSPTAAALPVASKPAASVNLF